MKRVLFIALALLLVSVLMAQRTPGEGKNCRQCNEQGKMVNMGQDQHPNMMMKIMHQLELTEAQQKQMEDLMVTMQKSAIDIKAKIEMKEIDARVAHKEMNFNQMKKISNEIFDLKKEMKNKQIDNQEACWNTLTAEQKELAKKMLKKPPMMRRDKQDDDDDDDDEMMPRHRRMMRDDIDD